MCCTLTVRKKKQTKARKRPGRINKAKIIIKEKEKKRDLAALFSISFLFIEVTRFSLFFSLSLCCCTNISTNRILYTKLLCIKTVVLFRLTGRCVCVVVVVVISFYRFCCDITESASKSMKRPLFFFLSVLAHATQKYRRSNC